MKRRRLGKTDLHVSIVGFGGIPIIALSLDKAGQVVKYAYEKGINYFDTARAYGDSEEKIGIALEDVAYVIDWGAVEFFRDFLNLLTDFL